MTAANAPAEVQERFVVSGTVQGVGFRPFVYRTATRLGLRGCVRNTRGGVEILAAGNVANLDALVAALTAEAPAPAAVESILRESAAAVPLPSNFQLAASEPSGDSPACLPADLAICDDCARELRDPRARRYRYPFTACAHCGPRYSIITALPYDRKATTMAAFPLCPRCQSEFEDPEDRRFHAQAIACPDCGPVLTLMDRSGGPLARGDAALAGAVRALHRGEVVALKGLGGYQLLADAGSGAAVAALRERKRRPRKPFALVVASLSAAEKLCAVSKRAAEALASAEAPIVLLRRLAHPEPGAPAVADGVAPDNPYLGLMLPCTPLHALLLDDAGGAVVATSGNCGGEPICRDDDEARERLGAIADCFLTHDRPIARAVDDSVVQVAAGDLQLLRRARGYVPRSVTLPRQARDCVLAVGAQHRNTIALTQGNRAFLSQHIGDLDSVAAIEAHERTIEDLTGLLALRPQQVVHDAHPDYASTQAAARLGLPAVPVQHQVAHVFAALAEYGLDPTADVHAVAWDGTGLGGDGAIRGGELFRVGAGGARRTGHLRAFRLPGGEGAIRYPYRCALALLHALDGPAALDDVAPDLCSLAERRAVGRLLETGLRSPLTTSAGRLFDAVASLLDLCQAVSYDGEAAQRLQFAAEAARDRGECAPPAAVRIRPGTPAVMDWEPALRAILEARRAGATAGACALAFHRALAEGLAACLGQDKATGTVLLTGGCFQNALLASLTAEALVARGLRPLLARTIPANDGGIALGQLWAAVHAQTGTRSRPAGVSPCA